MNLPDIPAIVERSLLAEPDTWEESVIHATDLAVSLPGDDGKCARQLWLRLRGAEKRERHRGELLMLDHGTQIHERILPLIEDGLPESWVIAGVEEAVEWMGVTGRYDLRLMSSEGSVIVDFKTVRGRAFQYMDGPRPANELQVQFYMLASGADAGVLLYIDREGQNYMRQYPVQPDDQAVVRAVEVARYIESSEIPPTILRPKLIINKNKGPDSVKLSMPWQCDYCDYLDLACDGALDPDYRVKGIIGHIDGGFTPKKGREHLSEIVENLLKEESC